MISVWHLVWIVPASAVMGVILLFYIVIFDDCMWWADDSRDKADKKGERIWKLLLLLTQAITTRGLVISMIAQNAIALWDTKRRKMEYYQDG